MTVLLTQEQQTLIQRPIADRVFLEGPAGTGKTTAGVQRLLHLLDRGIPADSILVLVPQRTLAAPYADALRSPQVRAGGAVSILTAGGLARRIVELFWPLVAETAGFAHPDQQPIFLTLETAQYYMARLVRPLLDEEGLFEAVTIAPNRLYSQILDNLNKAAVVGFPFTEIGERLQTATIGEPAQSHVYADAQRCAHLFRQYCLDHNLLDFSLQVEIFRRHLWPLPTCRDHLVQAYHHLIADNLEEDTPFAHDLLRDWLPNLRSALLILDQEAGFRSFLGADPLTALSLKALCDEHRTFSQSFVTTPALEALGNHLGQVLCQPVPGPPEEVAGDEVRATLVYDYRRYYPQMLDWVADEIARLVHEEAVPLQEIVVLAPFLSDVLRFSLMERLERREVAVRSHRPSRALREEPAAHCLLTLAALAHPHWGVLPSKFDFTYALVQAIAEMDLVRAQLLAEIVYRTKDGLPSLAPFEQINPEMHERLTYVLGGRYEGLRVWLADYAAKPEAWLDHFLRRLFGELLSQPGYGFHGNYDAGRVAANLVESVQKFRWVAEQPLTQAGRSLGREYWDMVQDGVIAAQYIRSWTVGPTDQRRQGAVLLAPAYTFLMSNRPVSYQFWLDAGSRGWFERLYQPLTHPYVLSRQWEDQRVWSDAEELQANQQRLYRLTVGLIRRCRRQVYLGLSELNEQGFELRGPLLMAIHTLLQRLPESPEMSPLQT